MFSYQVHDENGLLIESGFCRNRILNAGRTLALNVLLGATAKPTNWYGGLISSTSYSAIADADTMASHTGWTEFTSYNEAARQTLTFGTAASSSISTSSSITFTASAVGIVVGFFLVDVSTKGGSTGNIWCAGELSQNRSLQVGQTISVSYTAKAAAGG